MALRRSLLVALAVAFSLARGAAASAAEPATQFERAFARHQTELAAAVGRPEAVAALGALLDVADDLPPGRLEPVLRALVNDRRTDPLVAAQASYALAVEEARRGDAAAAERRFAGLGFVSAWKVVGPFEAQGRSSLGRAYPPEEAGGQPRPDARFPGKEREVGWRDAAGAFREGALGLDALLRPDNDATAYALTYVRSPRRQPAVIRIGSPGPIKVWLGGKLVLARNAVRSPAFDQDAATVTLPAGETAVLVKTVITSGTWRLFLRFTDQAGRPLAGLTTAAEGKAFVVPTAGGKLASKPARELGSLLRLRAEKSKGGARAGAWLDYARTLALTRAADRDEKVLEAALGKAVDAGAGPEASLLLSERAIEEQERRRALERVAADTKAEAGERALATAALAAMALGHGRQSAATAGFREALALDPSCVPALLAVAAEEQGAGLTSAALARLEALPAAVRALPKVRLARSRALEALGRRGDAEAEQAAVFAGRRTDLELALDLARAARTRGDLDAAIRLDEAVARQQPGMVFVWAEWARLCEGKGDLAAARRVLEEASARLIDEPNLHEELGRMLVRAGDTAAGLERLRRALALRPQNPTLRRYVERLASDASGKSGDAADDLARSWAEDGARIAAEALAAPLEPVVAKTGMTAKARARAGTDVLLDKQVVRVHRNGLSERFAQRLVLVRTDQAAREQQEFYVRYTPGSQEVEIRRAQVYRKTADGEVETLEASGRDDRDLSEPWYGLYYDNRAQVITFEGLQAGDVLEVEYTLADVSPENALADYFGDINFVAESANKRRWEYALIGPADRPFYFNQPKVAGFERKDQRKGGEMVYHFVARDVPRVEPEPSMPGWAEAAPYLHVSTYKSWEDVGRWYWRLVEDQLTSDETLRKAAADATVGARSLEEKVRAIHRFVVESTRYVGLEFGIHGYKPYRVTQVLARRFGDCKDKASLLVALLREVGVPSELVLLRTRRSGRVEASPASLAVFNHAITYVPALSLYLDGTAEFSGMAELPYEDQGVTALRVHAGAVTLVETPVLPSSTNRALRSWSAEVEPGGGGRIAEVVTITGQAAPEWRQHYQTPGERRERLGKVWSGRFPGAELEALTIEGAEDRNQPVVVRSTARVPRLGEPEGATLRLPVSAREPDLVRSYARLSERKHELLVAYPWQHEETLTFRAPEGWHVAAVPPSKRVESAFGWFEIELLTDKSSREIRVRSRMDVVRHRVPPAEYPAFRAFLGDIDGALRQAIVLRKDE